MPDFGLLSSKTVTEVLMLEMKMSPNAKTYLVSGYPRNMRDVVEYSEKIQIVQGVILISWRQKVLERQIDYGAKLGQVVLSLARMELSNFYKNVIPVAEYFDQSNMLISINGERSPGDVYKDFRAAVFRILGTQDNPPVFSNGKAAPVPNDVITTELPTMSKGTANQPYSVAEPSHSVTPPRPVTRTIHPAPPAVQTPLSQDRPQTQVISVHPGEGPSPPAKTATAPRVTRTASHGMLRRRSRAVPSALWIKKIRECISNGEMVPKDIVMKFINNLMNEHMDKEGIIIDGFPRDMDQARDFEAKYEQKPTLILLDCSKLQLGRGRLDDSVTAFRRRLEIFRKSSLPMLKAMDNVGRLTIVDGDTDTVPVQEDFQSVVKEHIDYLNSQKQEIDQHPMQNGYVSNGHVPNGYVTGSQINHRPPTPIQTVSGQVSNVAKGVHAMTNGLIANGKAVIANGAPHTNGFGPPKVAHVANGFVGGNGGQPVPRYQEVEMEGHI
ncbi:unnamed protein product [Callosobruchus maculatus]|uniref:Adenylate kinase isoenzyme 5 n=1 Tax=Callosobruchus maculatus TaxID=64391 RepID=A0A653BZY1_CALMS|nr:unnamed protein product [Callosobruchus maculatus]